MLLNVWLFHHTSSDKLRFQVLPLGNRRLSVDTDGTHSSQTFRVQDHPQGQMFDERRILPNLADPADADWAITPSSGSMFTFPTCMFDHDHF